MYVGDDQQMTCGPANTTSNRLSGRSAANAAGDKWSCIAVTHHGSQTHQFIMKIILKQKIIIIRQKYDTVFIILRLIRKKYGRPTGYRYSNRDLADFYITLWSA